MMYPAQMAGFSDAFSTAIAGQTLSQTPICSSASVWASRSFFCSRQGGIILCQSGVKA